MAGPLRLSQWRCLSARRHHYQPAVRSSNRRIAQNSGVKSRHGRDAEARENVRAPNDASMLGGLTTVEQHR